MGLASGCRLDSSLVDPFMEKIVVRRYGVEIQAGTIDDFRLRRIRRLRQRVNPEVLFEVLYGRSPVTLDGEAAH